MEIEIAEYLEHVSKEHLSDDTKNKIRIMRRQIGELESVGDACFKTALTIQRLRKSHEDFTPQQYTRLHEMLRLVNEALTQMMVVVSGRRNDLTLDHSLEIERDINALRDELRADIIRDVNAHQYSYAVGTFFGDVIANCEKLGDYVMNIVEARLGKRLISYRGLQMNLDCKTVTIDSIPISLTRTEFDLLSLLLSNRGLVLSRQQLMDTIWAGVIVTDRTVNVNIARLRKKLGKYAHNIVSRQGFGYVFEQNED